MAEKEVIRRLEAHIRRLSDEHREAIRQRDEALAGRDALKTQIRTLQAVSYTHLDVYKRQPERLERKKYNPFLKRVTVHREIK